MRGGRLGIVRVADLEMAIAVAADDAGAQFAPAAELAPEVEFDFAIVDAIGRKAAVALEDVEVLPLDQEPRHDEPVRRVPDRLVELGPEQRIRADLQVGLPLRAEPVHLGHLRPHAGVETVAALEVVLQLEPEAQEIRSPALLPCADLDAGQHAVPHQSVVERLEIVAAVEVREALVHLLRVERLAKDGAELGLDALAVALGALVRAHEVHDRLLLPGARARGRVLLPRVLVQRKPRQPFGVCAHRRKAEADQPRGGREIGRLEFLEIRRDEEVVAGEQRPLPAGLAHHHDRDGLVRNGERRGQLLARDRPEADVHRDHDVDAHRLHDIHRQVLHDPAVDQEPPIHLDRREHAGRRHARPHRGRQVAALEHDARAGLEVRCHGAKRRRQLVEIIDRGDRKRLEAQRLREPLALDESARHAKVAALDAERESHEELAVVLLAAEVERVARRPVAECGAPVDAAHERVDLRRGLARGIETADDGAHARAGDRIHRNVQFLERL